MPQAGDGPGRPTPKPRKVKRKPSVGNAISGVGKKKDTSFGVVPERNKARAKSQRVQRKVVNEIASTKPINRGTLKKIGGDVPKVVKPAPYRLVDPISRPAKAKAEKDEASTVRQLQKVSEKARKDLNEKGGSKKKFEKRDRAIETLKTVKDLPGTSKVDKFQAKYDREQARKRRKEMREAAMLRTPTGENQPAIKVEAPSRKTVSQIASGEATADLVAGAKSGLDKLKKAEGKIIKKIDDKLTIGKKSKKRRSTLALATGAGRLADPEIAVNAAKDAIDIPANIVPSVYLPARDIAHGRPGKALKDTVEGTKEILAHPTKHPLAAALTVSGAYGAAGRGAGKVARVVSRDRVGSTKGRAPKKLEGTSLEERRSYSKNIITKQVQKVTDKRGKPDEVSAYRVSRRVDHAMSRNEGVRRVNRDEVMGKVDDATKGKKKGVRVKVARTKKRNVPYPKVQRRQGKPVTAAAQVASQRIITGTDHTLLGELKAYRSQVAKAEADTTAKRAADPKAKRDLGPIHATQKSTLQQLDHAIRNFDEGEVVRAADAYAELSVKLQNNLVELGLLDAEQAGRARLIPYAVQKMDAVHDGDAVRLPDGSELTTDAIRAHMKANGVKEPAFITQAPDQRGAKNYYVAQHGGVVVRSPKRTGEATRKGSFDVHPDTMVEAAVRAQGLADAAQGWTRVLGEFGRRKDGKLEPHRSYKAAREEARILAEKGDGEWIPVKVAPFGVKKAQLEKAFQDADAEMQRKMVQQMSDAIAAVDGDPMDTSGNWILMNKTAAQRLNHHVKMIGRGGADPFGTAYGSLFRGVVLATSPKWLVGNIAEAGLRSLVAGAGPKSYVAGRKWIKAIEEFDPEYAKLVREEVLGGGVAGMSQRVNRHVSAQSFTEGGTLQRAAQIGGSISRMPVAKWVPAAWSNYTRFVFNFVNRGIERQFQTAMAGRAVMDQLLPEGLMRLSEKAIRDAANDSLDMNTVVALGEAVDKMYGRYSKFGPQERYWISTYTPFIRWSLNALTFVYKTLPKDHPVLTGVLASAHVASEDWRKDRGLSLFAEDAMPGFLQGSIPGEGGSHLRVSRYTPFGAFTDNSGAAGTVANSLLPQYMGVYDALAKGQDWKGKKIQGGMEDRFLEAGQQFAGGLIPFLSPITNIKKNEGDTKTKIRKQVDPFMFTQPKKKKSSGRRVVPKDDSDKMFSDPSTEEKQFPSSSEDKVF